MTLKEEVFSINEQSGSIDIDIRKISDKFQDLDVAQMLIKTQYKGEILLIGIEKDWKQYGDDVAVVKFKIGDRSGLFHLAAHASSFNLLGVDFPSRNIPIKFTYTGIDRLVKEAHERARTI